MRLHFCALAVAASLCALSLICVLPVRADGALYVKADATGANDGSSWANAFTSLQSALDVASSGHEVWVAQGVYIPTFLTDPADARSVTFVITNGVALYGGFSGAEAARDQRDWATHVVTLSGDIGVPGDFTDNASRVVTGSHTDVSAVLDGFTIADGNRPDGGGGMYIYGGSPTLGNCTFRGNWNWLDGGGGMYIHGGSPTLTNCTFSGNGTAFSGAGMYIRDGNPTLAHCTFNGNVIPAPGGGMCIWGGSPTLTDCTFSGNRAGEGGGIYVSGGTPTLTHCTFSGNEASYGGGVNIHGGNPTLTDCTFSDNRATAGGGMYSDESSPTLTNCTFSENVGGGYGGGGMYIFGGNPALTKCTFSENSATDSGGGMYIFGGNPTLTHCTFSDNRATAGGGGMFIYDDGSPTLTNCTFTGNEASSGGGMCSLGGSPTLANCTLQGNTAREGGGISSTSSGWQVRNSIFWDNGAEEINNGWETVLVLRYALVRGGCPAGADCAQILDADPRFVDPAHGDLRLGFDSPAIDAGNEAYVTTPTDLDGNPRIQGARVDLGAYEATPGVGIVKTVSPTGLLRPGTPLSYTLTYGNAGPLTATGVVITDLVPSQVAQVAYQASGVPVTATAGVCCVWQVADLTPGSRGAITLTGVISPALRGAVTFTNTARIASATPLAVTMGSHSSVETRVTVGGTRIYVRADAGGANDGSSWDDAFTSLQSALDVALSGHEIWVAQGAYTPTLRTDPGDARSVTFVITDGVALYGGFVGAETAREQRDWATHVVTLSGNIGAPGYTAYRVVTSLHTDASAVLDGFTVTRGDTGMYIGRGGPTVSNCSFVSNAGSDNLYEGGGMYISGGSPTLTNCSFRYNDALVSGGGMHIIGGSPTLAHCTFVDNRAVSKMWYYAGGGGIFIAGGSPTLTDCTFRGNDAMARSGGGLYITGSSPTLTRCTFSGNEAGEDGGGVYSYSGSSPTLTDCTFSDNSAYSAGGAMYTEGGSLTLAHCTFSGNYAQYVGGGLLISGGSPTITYCTFSENRARDGGGVSGGSPTLTNCTFSGNTAYGGGGGVSGGNPTLINCTFIGNTAYGDGGGISGGSPTLTNCTLQGNTAREGGGLYCTPDSFAQVRNSILWDNSVEQVHITGTVVLSHTLVQGGYPPGAQCTQIPDADPRFVDPVHSDLHLRFDSPAIDAGNDAYVTTATDLDGNPRIQGAHVDLGAYETTPVVGIFKAAICATPLLPGMRLTYTLAFGASGPLTATHVLITDVVPFQVRDVAYQASGVAITPTGGLSYTWQVADLAPGMRGVITLTGVVDPRLAGGYVLTNTARISALTGAADMTTAASTAVVEVAAPPPIRRPLYLPLIQR